MCINEETVKILLKDLNILYPNIFDYTRMLKRKKNPKSGVIKCKI